MSHRRFFVVVLAVVAALPPLGARADALCDPLSDPQHAPSQWEYLCHQGLRGEIPNDPTQKNPASRFSFAPASGIQPGDLVTFDGSASAPRNDDRPLRDWVWDFGDGGQATGTLVTHAYRTAGQFITSLWVHDAIGWRGHSTKLVTVGTLPASDAIRESFTVPSRANGGVVLQGQVTRPNAPGRFPVVLTFGPYCPYTLGDADKTMALVRSGYAFATVVAPGLCGSTGAFDMFADQTQIAGYDAVEYVAAQPWSDGNVGLTGFSGPAVGAALVAGARPPHLKAAAIMATYADQYRDQIYPGGIPNSNTFVNAWRSLLLNDPRLQSNTAEIANNWQQNMTDMLAHPTDDWFWKARSIVSYPSPTAAVMIIGSDHDLWPRAQFELARWIAPGGGRVVQCVGSHGCNDPSGFESPEFLPAGGQARAWLDHFLKGIDNGAEGRPTILSYTQEGGDVAGLGFNAARWTALDSWPESIHAWKTLYLDATPSTGPIRTLSGSPPVGLPGSAPDLVAAGPAQGVTKGNTSALGVGSGTVEEQQVDDAQTLTYETPVLDQDLTVVGPMTLHVFATLATPDFAWSAQVEDVWPDGSSNFISEGYLLASHRALDEARSLRNEVGEIVRPYHPHTAGSVQQLSTGVVYDFQIEIWGVGNTFRRGHRLRLSLAGQNAGWRQNAVPGLAAVMHDVAQPSALLLPVVPSIMDPHPFALP